MGMAPYRALVALNGGNMSGRAVLANFILMQPQTELGRQLQLLENLDDPQHVERYRVFEDWFKHTQDIPGAFYLWLVEHLFHRTSSSTAARRRRPARRPREHHLPAVPPRRRPRPHHAPGAALRRRRRRRHAAERDRAADRRRAGTSGCSPGARRSTEDWPVLMAEVYAQSTSGLARGA